MHQKSVHMATFILMVVGAINWGLVGLFDFNVVTAVFGTSDALVKGIYILVGISGVYEFITHATSCKWCSMKK